MTEQAGSRFSKSTRVQSPRFSVLGSGPFDEDATHGLGRSSEEVAPALPPLDLLDVHQAQVGLVHQGGGLQGLTRLFLGQLVRRQFAQFVVDERQELLGRVRLAALDSTQDLGEAVHHGPVVGGKGLMAGV